MKKLFWLATSLCLLLGFGGCAKDSPSDLPSDAPSDLPAGAPASDEYGGPIEIPAAEMTMPGTSDSRSPMSQLEGLEQDEYDGVTVTAVIRERMALLPGGRIPVTVMVENKGDKSILYVQGSGSYSTPQALFGNSEHLQYVTPEDNLGIATMDFAVRELAPGESLDFKVFFMAVEPSDDFNKYTQEQFFTDQTYIANMPWDELHEAYPDLVATQSGSYDASIYFMYILPGESSMPIFTGAPTGFAKSDLVVGIS